jgi:hypothetical protein
MLYEDYDKFDGINVKTGSARKGWLKDKNDHAVGIINAHNRSAAYVFETGAPDYKHIGITYRMEVPYGGNIHDVGNAFIFACVFFKKTAPYTSLAGAE